MGLVATLAGAVAGGARIASLGVVPCSVAVSASIIPVGNTLVAIAFGTEDAGYAGRKWTTAMLANLNCCHSDSPPLNHARDVAFSHRKRTLSHE